MNHNTKTNNKYILAVFIIFLLIAAIIAVIFITNKEDDKTGNTPVQSDTAAYINNDETFAGDSSILFVCNGENIGDALFAILLDFRIYSETINITLLDINTVNNNQTYSDSYRYGGIDSLLNSVESVRKCTINRYMLIDKAGLGKITDKLGNISIYVTDNFTYNATDKSYEISAGNNELGAEALYTYLSILSTNADNSKLKETICEIIKTYIAKINSENSEMIFGEICNSATTNITITDYFTSKEDFNYLLSHNPECNITDDIAEE